MPEQGTGLRHLELPNASYLSSLSMYFYRRILDYNRHFVTMLMYTFLREKTRAVILITLNFEEARFLILSFGLRDVKRVKNYRLSIGVTLR